MDNRLAEYATEAKPSRQPSILQDKLDEEMHLFINENPSGVTVDTKAR
jgi:hypothetical protein